MERRKDIETGKGKGEGKRRNWKEKEIKNFSLKLLSQTDNRIKGGVRCG